MQLKINRQKGNMAVWLILTIPLLVVFLLFFVNVAIMIDTKMGLQAAVDRGTYAGAGYLSHVMNEVAGLNKEFRDQYLKKESTFNSDSMDNAGWIEDQVKELKNNQSKIHEEMTGLLNEGYMTAHAIAQDVTKVNLEKVPQLGQIRYEPEYGWGRMFDMIDDWDGFIILNEETLKPIEIEGVSMDPNNYKKYEYVVRKYLIKSPDKFVAISGSVRAQFAPPYLTNYFTRTGSFQMGAIAAAQPYGGSVKEYSLSGGDEEYLYHPGFIPVRLLVEDADVTH